MVIFLDSRRTVFIFHCLFDLLDAVLAILISILKNSLYHFNTFDTGLHIELSIFWIKISLSSTHHITFNKSRHRQKWGGGVTGDLNCIHDKGLRSLFEKGPKYRLPSRIDFTKCRNIVKEALQSYCKRWCKKENVGEHALNDWKNEFLRIIDIRIENFTKHPHLYKQPTSRSVKSLKRKMEKLHSKYVFAPADKAANNVIIIWKKYYVEVLKSELNSTSAYVPANLTKDKLLQRHIDSLTKSNIKIDKIDLPTFYWLPKLHKNPYKSRFISNSSHCSTTILSKHITSALTAVKDHAIRYSETAFRNSNVNYFWSIKNSSDVIEKLRLRKFRVLKYLLPIFLHYTHHCRMILSKKKCCLLLNGVSTGSQKRTKTSRTTFTRRKKVM